NWFDLSGARRRVIDNSRICLVLFVTKVGWFTSEGWYLLVINCGVDGELSWSGTGGTERVITEPHRVYFTARVAQF
ncbi:MAG TPA: hypothetical protein VGJ04_10140, partial [Pirellulales bacterium]